MKKFIAKRLAQMLVVFVAVSMFAFSIIYFSPGDPLYLYTSPAVSSYKMSDEQLDAMRESLGLNGNVAERYVSWAGKMLINTAKAGYFSSDRTIAEYNRDIWKL